MKGGVLVASRAVNNHKFIKKRLEDMGIKNVFITAVDKDGLNLIIHDMKPELMIMDAKFYQCSTPYMMGLIKKEFPDLNMAAVCIDDYPADLGMYFIVNGVNSYFNLFEGIEQFKLGIENILNGKIFVSEIVKKRIKMSKIAPTRAKGLSKTKIEVIRCICNGFQKKEIADTLYLAPSTVESYREEIYRSLNVRNVNELHNAAIMLEFFKEEELIFRHKNFKVKPFPINDEKNSYYYRKKRGEIRKKNNK
jgi:DNA-binding NarL/FixJ family response regulator